jgi:hypothetical protein
MPRKPNAIYSDPTGAAAAASPVRHRTGRTKASESISTTVSRSDAARAGATDPTIDRDTVARLAYSYWEARGFAGGSAEEDWLRAERELREGIAASADA